jgi:hypothetical protein
MTFSDARGPHPGRLLLRLVFSQRDTIGSRLPVAEPVSRRAIRVPGLRTFSVASRETDCIHGMFIA